MSPHLTINFGYTQRTIWAQPLKPTSSHWCQIKHFINMYGFMTGGSSRKHRTNHATRSQLPPSYVSNQPRKIAGSACAGNAGNGFFPSPQVSVTDLYQGTWAMHVPWCMPVSLTSGFLWSRWRGKRSRYSRRMRNTQFCVTSMRPMLNKWVPIPHRRHCDCWRAGSVVLSWVFEIFRH